MPNYRRWRIAGGTYFFTVVTYRRRPILCDGDAPDLLRSAFRECRRTMPFRIDAIVVLPDHLHAIWTLPDGDHDFSKRWGAIKRAFSKAWLERRATPPGVASAKRREGRVGVWQPRFWERCVRDEDELDAFFDYIHYNPVKHGLATAPGDWKRSSFRRWSDRGLYHPDWGRTLDGTMTARLERVAKLTGE